MVSFKYYKQPYYPILEAPFQILYSTFHVIDEAVIETIRRKMTIEQYRLSVGVKDALKHEV